MDSTWFCRSWTRAPVVGAAPHEELPIPAIAITLLVGAVVAVGVAGGYLLYSRQRIAAETPGNSSVSAWTRAGRAELYGNEFNDAVLVRPTRHLTRFLVWFDHMGIDAAVTGLADRLGDTSQFLRKPQTGYVRSYALTMFGGAVLVLLALLAVTLA